MLNILVALGWFGFALAAIWFIFHDQSASNSDYVQQTKDILIVAAAMVLGGYTLKYLTTVSGVGQSRCKVCKKRIPKKESYCFDHRREKIWDAKDKSRYIGN